MSGAIRAALALLLTACPGPPSSASSTRCRPPPLDKTYRLVTDCGGSAEETLRVTLDTEEQRTGWPANVSHIGGTMFVTGVFLKARCRDPGNLAQYTSITFDIEVEGLIGAGKTHLQCAAGGTDATFSTCTGGGTTCTLRIESVPAPAP